MKIKDKKIDIARLVVSLMSLICFATYIVYLIVEYRMKPGMPEIIGDLLIGGTPMLLGTIFSVISYKYKKSRVYPVLIILSYLLISLVDLTMETNIGIYNMRIFHRFIEWHYDINITFLLVFLAFVALMIYMYKSWLVIAIGAMISLESICSFIVCYIDGYRFFSIYVLSIASFLLGISACLFSNNIKEDNDIFQLLDKIIHSDDFEDYDDIDSVQGLLSVSSLFNSENKDYLDCLVFYNGMKNKEFEKIQHLYNEEFAIKFSITVDEIISDYLLSCSVDGLNDDYLRFQYALKEYILKGKSNNIIYDLFRAICYKTDFRQVIDVKYKSEWSELSNFANHPFELCEGMKYNSIEAFLQSLKFKNPKFQKRVANAKTGAEAKKFSNGNYYWSYRNKLFLGNYSINRFEPEYEALITTAFDKMAESNENFVKALLNTGDKKLIHSVGKTSKWDTVLTRDEYIRQLIRLRIKYKNLEKYNEKI